MTRTNPWRTNGIHFSKFRFSFSRPGGNVRVSLTAMEESEWRIRFGKCRIRARCVPLLTILAVLSACARNYPSAPPAQPSRGQAPVPTVTLTASPGSIVRGQTAVLSWSSTHATSVNLAPGGGGGPAGSMAVRPAFTTTYFVTATGPGGTATSSATVVVRDPIK